MTLPCGTHNISACGKARAVCADCEVMADREVKPDCWARFRSAPPDPKGYGAKLPDFMKSLLRAPPPPIGGPVVWLEQPLGARFICNDCEFWYAGHRPIEYWHKRIKVYGRPAWLRVAQCEHATRVGLLTEVDR
jgi:hypothetical protein